MIKPTKKECVEEVKGIVLELLPIAGVIRRTKKKIKKVKKKFDK